MKNYFLIAITSLTLISSCFPEKLKKEMDEGMRLGLEMLTDQDFKKAIGFVELHKLRSGVYPNSLNELKFMGQMDSSIFNFVSYSKLDSGYELNLKMKYSTFQGESDEVIRLKYPKEFWEGLGCVKSNLKD